MSVIPLLIAAKLWCPGDGTPYLRVYGPTRSTRPYVLICKDGSVLSRYDWPTTNRKLYRALQQHGATP